MNVKPVQTVGTAVVSLPLPVSCFIQFGEKSRGVCPLFVEAAHTLLPAVLHCRPLQEQIKQLKSCFKMFLLVSQPRGWHLIGQRLILQQDNNPKQTARVLKNYPGELELLKGKEWWPQIVILSPPPRRLCFHPCLLDWWFVVNKIIFKKRLNKFSRNLVERCDHFLKHFDIRSLSTFSL